MTWTAVNNIVFLVDKHSQVHHKMVGKRDKIVHNYMYVYYLKCAFFRSQSSACRTDYVNMSAYFDKNSLALKKMKASDLLKWSIFQHRLFSRTLLLMLGHFVKSDVFLCALHVFFFLSCLIDDCHSNCFMNFKF